jgi:hypothetical protein
MHPRLLFKTHTHGSHQRFGNVQKRAFPVCPLLFDEPVNSKLYSLVKDKVCHDPRSHTRLLQTWNNWNTDEVNDVGLTPVWAQT